MDILVKSNKKLSFNGKEYDCILGRSGIADKISEGDGITPIGKYPLRNVYYRPDKIQKPKSKLNIIEINENMGWCDDPEHPDYNKLIQLPFDKSHEKMFRDDDLYNLVIEIGYNDKPAIKNLGSAIFIHVKNPKLTPTEGCVALDVNDLIELLKVIDINTKIIIEE